jgi:hypothetical protein
MTAARLFGASVLLCGCLALLSGPLAWANPSDDDGGGDGGGCPPGGCVNVYEPDDGHSGSSSGHSSTSGSSSSADDGDHQKDDGKRKDDKTHEPETPRIYTVPPQRPPVHGPATAPVPRAPASDFVPAAVPVLEQDAESRGSGEVLPEAGAEPTDADPEPTSRSGESGPPWGLLAGAAAVMLVGAGLAFAPSRRPGGGP